MSGPSSLSRLGPVGGRCVAQTGRTSPLLSRTWRGIGRERIRTWRSTTTRRPASCVTGRFRRGSGYVNLRRGIRPRSVVRCPFLAQVVSWNPDQNCTPNWSWPRAGVHRIPWQQGRYPEVSGFRPVTPPIYATASRVTRPEGTGGPFPADLEPPASVRRTQLTRRAATEDDHGRDDRRELLANRYGKSSRSVATLDSRGLHASSRTYVSPTGA